jgi:hypothetical protein
LSLSKAETAEDPRLAPLRAAVTRLRRELADHRADLPDRDIAETELEALRRLVTVGGVPALGPVQRSLLLVVGAIGSVSALGSAVGELRRAVETLG